MDHLLVVNGTSATPATETSLHEHHLMERRHLQEWVIANPKVLGEDVLVITSEFGSWAADTDGAPAHDRLDVLALDGTGRLVVVELKRGLATRDVHLQAITYAALVSRFTLDTLTSAHRDFLRKRGTEVDLDEARSRLLDHVGDELDPELLRRPRLVLIATGFPKQVTHTVVWLSEMNVDIDLVEVSVWQVEGQLVAGFSRIYPIPEVDAFTLAPAREETTTVQARVERRTRSRNAVHLLVEAGLLPDGTRMRMVPGHGTTAGIRDDIAAWVAVDDRRQWARWHNARTKPLRWDVDGELDSATGLAERVFTAVTGESAQGIQGTAWWILDDDSPPPGVDPDDWTALQGRTLVGLAEEVRPALRDWSDLHEVLDAIPAGRWTSYGDVAAAIGSHAVPVGSHIAQCGSCTSPWRVLNAKGRVSSGFRWSAPRNDTPQELLAAEGLAMPGGVADQSRQLGSDDLLTLLDGDGAT
ncbi:DNA-binding protein [Pseudonocardia sp. AL041005-10]|nr:MGMT family protein [Pseudonocardia sp. AL041005-10]ALE78005.1 DNA-binding protein [Pseudonocardia sp. AL041005-10]